MASMATSLTATPPQNLHNYYHELPPSNHQVNYEEIAQIVNSLLKLLMWVTEIVLFSLFMTILFHELYMKHGIVCH